MHERKFSQHVKQVYGLQGHFCFLFFGSFFATVVRETATLCLRDKGARQAAVNEVLVFNLGPISPWFEAARAGPIKPGHS